MRKRNLILLAIVFIIFTPFISSGQVCGGNGTPDGAQVNRDYKFCFDLPDGCSISSVRVLNPDATSQFLLVGNTLFLVWKPEYVGTTQTTETVVRCRIGSKTITETITAEFNLHN